MTGDAGAFGFAASWAGTAIGVGLWLFSAFGPGDAIRKLRFRDCGTVIIFSSILLRVLLEGPPMDVFDWIIAVLAPLFIAAALWRLARTAEGRR